MKNSIFVIMKKELARFFGDRRMAFTTILLPGIMIYVLYSFMGSALSDQFSVDDTYVPTIQAVNLPESIETISASAGIKFEKVSQADIEPAKQAITDSALDALVVFPGDFDSRVAAYSSLSGTAAPNVALYYNSAEANSDSAYNMVLTLLDGYESAMTNKFDINNSDTAYDLAKQEDLAAMMFSSMLPMLLLIFMFSGCMAVAPESIAGEKERGTIATLLITPTKRSHIAVGKILALSVIALLSGASSTAGTILSLPKLAGMASEEMSMDFYGVSDYLMLGIVILSTVLVLISVISIVSAFAKTVKEAQTYISPLMILVILVGVTAMFGGGAKTELWYYLIPVYNSVQCMVSIFTFDMAPVHIAAAIASNLVCTGVAVFILTRMFNSEKIVFSR